MTKTQKSLAGTTEKSRTCVGLLGPVAAFLAGSRLVLSDDGVHTEPRALNVQIGYVLAAADWNEASAVRSLRSEQAMRREWEWHERASGSGQPLRHRSIRPRGVCRNIQVQGV